MTNHIPSINKKQTAPQVQHAFTFFKSKNLESMIKIKKISKLVENKILMFGLKNCL